MKADTHPDYHFVEVKMTDGSTFKTRTTWGKEGDTMTLDIDSKSHPVYTGGGTKVIEKGQLDKFNSKFGSMDFLGGESDDSGVSGETKEEA